MRVPQNLSDAYERSYKRGIYGLIGDRYADGVSAIIVVGDRLLDVDEFHEVVKERDGYQCLKRVHVEERHGGAAAVTEMVRGLGVQAKLATDSMNYSVKTRIIANNHVICRLDKDHAGTRPPDLSPAALVLIADYGKGVVNEQTMAGIARQYKNREIIADWHPSKPAEFYQCATALKASWDCPVSGNKPIIKTMGALGLVCHTEGESFAIPSVVGPVVDPCGAGDMVLATLGVGRLAGLSWRQCCEWAVQNAALVCQQWGAIPVASNAPTS